VLCAVGEFFFFLLLLTAVVVQTRSTEYDSIKKEFERTALDRATMIESRVDSYALCMSENPVGLERCSRCWVCCADRAALEEMTVSLGRVARKAAANKTWIEFDEFMEEALFRTKQLVCVCLLVVVMVVAMV
jgi:hypothetical protein